MSTPWRFEVDARADAFCQEVASELMRLFGVSAEEAVGRINRHWSGQAITGEDIVYHETADYWAHVMYYGKESSWWITGEKRASKGLGPLTPKPYTTPSDGNG
jgi:hypothetical protein